MRTDLKIQFRNLNRYKKYTVTNVIGLAIAFIVLTLIFQFASFELSYDAHLDNGVFRIINARYKNSELIQRSTVSYSALGPAMLKDYPDVLQQSRIFPIGNTVVKLNGNLLNVDRSVAVEPAFLDMFQMEFLIGSPLEVFHKPNEILLTEPTARRLLNGNKGLESLIDKTIRLDSDLDDYIIKGVVKVLPENSHLNYDLFLSYPTIVKTWGIKQADFDWRMLDFRHYVQLKKGADVNELNQQLETLSENYQLVGQYEEVFTLQAVKDIYLDNSNIEYDVAKKGDVQLLYLLISLGSLLYIISWVNYLNLSSAFAIEKSKFITIRKVLGASTKNLISYQIIETLFINLLAITLGVSFSIIVTEILQMNGFSLKSLEYLLNHNLVNHTLLALILGGISISILFSIFFTVRFQLRGKPSEVIRQKDNKSSLQNKRVSSLLLSFQFFVSIITFALGLVVYQQHNHLTNAPLGLNLKNLWVISQPKFTPTDSAYLDKLATFKAQLTSYTDINSVTVNQRVPGQQIQLDAEASFRGNSVPLAYIGVDNDYLSTYKIPLLVGQNFSEANLGFRFNTVDKAIVNLSTLKLLGIKSPQEAIGESITILGSSKEIIGVVNDFRQQSLMHNYQPTVLLPVVHANHQLVIATDRLPSEFIDRVEKTFTSLFPDNPFQYRELETEYFKSFSDINSANKVFSGFSMIAILLSVFGMIAMASQHLLSRLKEFAIRKVLGASSLILYKEVALSYLKKVLFASIVAIPIFVYVSYQWLLQFQSHIEINGYYVLLPIIIITGIIAFVLFLISYRTIHINPVDVLSDQ